MSHFRKFPDWFHWFETSQGLGMRLFTPKWWQRRSYYEGLHDAARIIEGIRWVDSQRAPGFPHYMKAIQAIQDHAIKTFGERK